MCCAGPSLPPEVSAKLQMGNWSPALEGWLRTTLNSARLPAPVQAYMVLLGDCHTAMSIARDVGYEAALQHLGRQCIAAAAPSDKASYDTARDEPEVDPLVSQLLKDLAEHVCSLLPVLQALEPGQGSAHMGFPKLQALIRFLSDMHAKETAWHGIVFVKERQSVHTLTHMLQQVPEFANEVSFHPFTGHGHQKQQQVTVGSFSRGMKTKAQKDALESFRCGEGRQVLVATAAAEEGLDIVSCQFVVCFTVVESGRELVQRAGRARMRGSQVVHIVEHGSGDEATLLKAEQEKLNAGNAQLHFRHVVP